MHLFYHPEIITGTYTLPSDESKHCLKVLRLKQNDKVYVTDGRGHLFKMRIAEPLIKGCVLELISTENEIGKRAFKIHLAVAPTKNINRFEWFLEKATEIGIDEITPVICENSERTVVKKERLNRIMISAMKQSLTSYLPVLNEAVSFKNFMAKQKEESAFIAYCSDEYRESLKNSYVKGNNSVVLIGPEGDFSNDEIVLAMSRGYKPVSLGPGRLRTETAALVACMTINLVNQ